MKWRKRTTNRSTRSRIRWAEKRAKRNTFTTWNAEGGKERNTKTTCSRVRKRSQVSATRPVRRGHVKAPDNVKSTGRKEFRKRRSAMISQTKPKEKGQRAGGPSKYSYRVVKSGHRLTRPMRSTFRQTTKKVESTRLRGAAITIRGIRTQNAQIARFYLPTAIL